jgi:hypothetical protein
MKKVILALSLMFSIVAQSSTLKLDKVEFPKAYGSYKKPVSISLTKGKFYTMACRNENVLYHLVNKKWVNVNYIEHSFGCDEFYCRENFGPLVYDLVDYELPLQFDILTDKKIPQKSKLLNGRFQAIFVYFTDAKCKNRAKQEIEFESP